MNLKGHMRELVLGVALVALLFYLFMPSVPQGGDPGADGEERKAVTGAAASILDGPDLDLALLTQQPGDYDGGGRNLFDYGHIAPPPPSAEELARRAREAEAARLRAEEERKLREAEQERLREEARKRQEELAKQRREEPKPPPPKEPPKPVPPDFPYKFIGILGEADSKIAIFLDDSDFLLAKEGEDVKEEFRIVRIGYDTLQIGYTDPQFTEESRILQMGKD
jgi:hypothetical protein